MIADYWLSAPTYTGTQRTAIIEHFDSWVDARKAGNAFRFSGAMAALTHYRRRRAL